ncbi:hypothetical protein BDV93DRAFT_561099 [Ceratobasidium sp. AG-I]|nr:hypothetical protein BDV93DRAFT_561099 [Ceratobasidium sp. AG-I]
MSSNPSRRSHTVDSSWPKLAPNANTNVGASLSTAGPAKKLTLPATSASSNRNVNGCEVLDEFNVGPGVATLSKKGDGDEGGTGKLSKSLNGLEESRLNAGVGARPSSLARPPGASAHPPRARPLPARPTTPTPLPRIETRTTISYRDIALKSSLSPPPSPVLGSIAIPAPSLKPAASKTSVTAPKPTITPVITTTTPAPKSRAPSLPTLTLQNSKQDTSSNEFPPLSPIVSSAPTIKTSASSKSYANAAVHVPTVPVQAGAALGQAVSSPERQALCLVRRGVLYSPVCTPAKVISLNIGATPVRRASHASSLPTPAATPSRAPPPPSPTTKKRRNKSSGSADTKGLLFPTPNQSQSCSRQRSPSLSSVVTFSSSASVSPMTGNTSTLSLMPRPSWEGEAWYPSLVEFAREMPKKSRLAWEKILRSNPKDTSKMKWPEFDAALRALGFESKARGGSDLEYTPSKFGDAQPISYHRPHPGQEFSLGDLKAKGHSFRQRYPGPVAALHEAWDLVDTRC